MTEAQKWPNLEWPNLAQDRTSKVTEPRMTEPRKWPNLERPNLELDQTSKDRTSNGTEPRKWSNIFNLINLIVRRLIHYVEYKKSARNKPKSASIMNFQQNLGKSSPQSHLCLHFSTVPEQHGGWGHYLSPQQKRRTEPQGQGRLRLH